MKTPVKKVVIFQTSDDDSYQILKTDPEIEVVIVEDYNFNKNDIGKQFFDGDLFQLVLDNKPSVVPLLEQYFSKQSGLFIPSAQVYGDLADLVNTIAHRKEITFQTHKLLYQDALKVMLAIADKYPAIVECSRRIIDNIKSRLDAEAILFLVVKYRNGEGVVKLYLAEKYIYQKHFGEWNPEEVYIDALNNTVSFTNIKLLLSADEDGPLPSTPDKFNKLNEDEKIIASFFIPKSR